jgi:hypothetical protein
MLFRFPQLPLNEINSSNSFLRSISSTILKHVWIELACLSTHVDITTDDEDYKLLHPGSCIPFRVVLNRVICSTATTLWVWLKPWRTVLVRATCLWEQFVYFLNMFRSAQSQRKRRWMHSRSRHFLPNVRVPELSQLFRPGRGAVWCGHVGALGLCQNCNLDVSLYFRQALSAVPVRFDANIVVVHLIDPK